MDVKKAFQAPFRRLYFLSKSKEAWKCKHMVNKRDHSQHKKKNTEDKLQTTKIHTCMSGNDTVIILLSFNYALQIKFGNLKSDPITITISLVYLVT